LTRRQKVFIRYIPNALGIRLENPRTRVYGHEGTPLMIGGALYISTSLGHVAALDAQTGQTIWSYDTGSFKAGRPTNNGFLHRSVA
jgi:quinoprotein glucose dehydrogenase